MPNVSAREPLDLGADVYPYAVEGPPCRLMHAVRCGPGTFDAGTVLTFEAHIALDLVNRGVAVMILNRHHP